MPAEPSQPVLASQPGDATALHAEAGHPIVGIDLGTTNSLVAICDERGPRVIPDSAGQALLPSVVRYEADDSQQGYRTVVGGEARQFAPDFPRRTITSVKRLMGRSSGDAQRDAAYLSYEVVAGERNTARVSVPLGDQPGSRRLLLSPEEVSAQVLLRLKGQASIALGQDIRKAVVTVPAYFDDAQRQATRTAGRLAGLEVVRIVPEPTAAALAYGIGLPRRPDGPPGSQAPATVAVYDLGGGTFDVSILRLTPGEHEGDTYFFQVLATAGDTHLGGDDIDHLLVGLFRREIAQILAGPSGAPDAEAIDLPPGTRRQLVVLAEAVKCRLSEHEAAAIKIDLGVDRAYERTITREELEALVEPLVSRTVAACRRALSDAQRALPPEGVGAVIMVGGSTRIPLVRRRVGEFFGLPPYTALDPDRVVALGAAVQASILSGRRKGALLLDVIPLSLGVETVGGAVAKLIMRNATLPARATEMFSTSVDGQTSIRLTVLQGEREMAADCRRLGEFHLRGIPPMPAGVPQLEVAFLVDANGVLNVSALERRSGKRASLQVIPNYGLTADEVASIEQESFAHARDDMTQHRVVDLIANSRLDLKWIGERFDRYGTDLEPTNREHLASTMGALRALLAKAQEDWRSVDPDALHRAKEDLDRASIRLQEVGITRSLAEDDAR